jgi:hypothetical protein
MARSSTEMGIFQHVAEQRGLAGAAVQQHMPLYTARVIKLPERRTEIAKIRGQIAEMKQILSVRCGI